MESLIARLLAGHAVVVTGSEIDAHIDALVEGLPGVAFLNASNDVLHNSLETADDARDTLPDRWVVVAIKPADPPFRVIAVNGKLGNSL